MKAPAPACVELLEARIAPASLTAIDIATLNGSKGFKIIPGDVADQAIASVTSAGDVNGDGFDDVIINSRSVSQPEASYVVFGHGAPITASFDLNTLDGTNGFKLTGHGYFSVSAAGDVNGDGFADLIAGTSNTIPFSGNDGYSSGYVVFGKAGGFAASIDLTTLDGMNGFKLKAPSEPAFTGFSVSGAGDVNGDGLADFLVGVQSGVSLFKPEGGSYLIFGKSTGFGASFDFTSVNGTDGFGIGGLGDNYSTGAGVSSAGDVNGDGFDDIIIGALTVHAIQPDGSIRPVFVSSGYVVFGGAAPFPSGFDLTTLNGSNGFKLDAAFAHGAGDMNGDGFADLLVSGGVLFGKATPFKADVKVSALNGLNGFKAPAGTGFNSAGDVNGDGFADLIATTLHPNASLLSPKLGYVVYGKAGGFTPILDLSTLTVTQGFKITDSSRASGDSFQIGNVGDVNGDGFADLIVGKNPFDSAGESSVIFGNATGKSYSFIDTDGDRVKVTTSKGVLSPNDFTFSASGSGQQLESLDLTNSAFAGADITISATPRMVNGILVGNGHVNVGEIDATDINLGTVSIAGDLTELHAGDGTGTGVLTLHTTSLGKHADLFPALTPGLDVAGRVAQITVGHDVSDFTMKIGVADEQGVGVVQVGGNFTASTLGVGSKIGQFTITGSLVDSTLFAPGVQLPPTVAAARAIGTLTVNGSVQGTSILAGYDAGGNAINGDAGIGTVTIKGDFTASNLVAGIADSTHDGFGQNDTVIPGGNDAILATIAALTIKGAATGSVAPGDFFGITAAHFGAAKIHGFILQLTNEPTSFFALDSVNNDLRLTVV